MRALITGGAVVGCQAGIEHPDTAQAAGEAAGQLFAQKYMGAIFLFALIVSVVGSALGLLPGTGKKD